MTDDHGTFELRTRGNKVEVAAENAVGGATCMVDRWHTYADFLRDLNLITQDHHDAFSEYLELFYASHGRNAPGGQGTGSKYQEWISFGRMIGAQSLHVLSELREAQSPSSAYPVQSPLDATRKAHSAALRAGEDVLATQMAQEVDRLQNLLKMREAVISAHRIAARWKVKIWNHALESAEEAFQFLRDEKNKLDEKTISEL